jgi:hypothetical protein
VSDSDFTREEVLDQVRRWQAVMLDARPAVEALDPTPRRQGEWRPTAGYPRPKKQ